MKLRSIEVQGFRAFVSQPQRLDFTNQLALIRAPNSQGKTSLVEAFEFLLTGRTVRRDLLGGAVAEFSDALRNAHLPFGASVYVRAEIFDNNGVAHDVRRTLTADYSALEDCRSELTIDGQPVEDLSSLGIHLSQPPLQAPVLLHHTVRFVVSARPQDRADYFKAVVEVQDLELVRNELVSLQDHLEEELHPILLTLQRIRRVPTLSQAAQEIEDSTPTQSALEQILSRRTVGLLINVGITRDQIPGDLLGQTRVLREVIRRRREQAFPIEALFSRVDDLPPFDFGTLRDLERYNQNCDHVEPQASQLRRVFEALLELPAVAAAAHPLDCPVCETPQSLSPLRVASLRRFLEDSQRDEETRRIAMSMIEGLQRVAETVERSLQRTLPQAASWENGQTEQYARTVAELLPQNGVQLFQRWQRELGELAREVQARSASVSSLLAALRGEREAVNGWRRVELERLRARLETCLQDLRGIQEKREQYTQVTEQMTDPLRQSIDQRVQTSGWTDLADLCDAVSVLVEASRDRQARRLVRGHLEEAVREVDEAKAAVFDARFQALSNEIESWWNRLRPTEPVQFGGLRRRGTGRRFLDFKALLLPRVGAPGVERNAVGIFSDSQLNCLGLSAFLARCVREAVAFIVLDDPVPASDEEHRATFARYVVESLLGRSTQLILATHDDDLIRLLQDYYQHLSLDVFTISMDTPDAGPIVTKTSHTLDAMFERARPFIGSYDPEIRKVAARHLRDAAERLCKEIVVKHRRGRGEECSILEYDRLTLFQLEADTVPFLRDPSHPGKLRGIAHILNPGSHDDQVPERNELAVAFGDLKAFSREYL